MTYKHLTLFLLSLFISFGMQSQTTSVEKDFVRKLIKSEYSNTDEMGELNITEPPYYVILGEEIDRYTVEYYIIAHEDLNNDGVHDYVILRNSMGMLGGNANTNQEYKFFIMKNDFEIEQEHSILAYAPFSYNIIDSTDYQSKILTAEIVQNFRTYYGNEDGEMKRTTARFKYQDGNLYELSYLTNCQMGEMKDKTIFKADLPNVERMLSMDYHNYTEISSEKYTQNEFITIDADLSGCDNLQLEFRVTHKNGTTSLNSPDLSSTQVLKALDTLSEITRYSSLIKKIKKNFESKSYNGQEKTKSRLDDTWLYEVSQHHQSEKENYFYIRITNEVNPNQTENWEITTRQK